MIDVAVQCNYDRVKITMRDATDNSQTHILRKAINCLAEEIMLASR